MPEPFQTAELKKILLFAAQNGYASEAAKKVTELDGSTSIRLQHGDWLVHDNYFTSEDGRRYHGNMVAFLSGKAMWFCGYSGFVAEKVDPGEVYGFLKKAMLLPEPDFPVRGPWHFSEVGWEYNFKKLTSDSTLERFQTLEKIVHDGQPVYEGVFYGGAID